MSPANSDLRSLLRKAGDAHWIEPSRCFTAPGTTSLSAFTDLKAHSSAYPFYFTASMAACLLTLTSPGA
eukprot:CAMPEP_0172605822 /NCGR_PEP_ID=MMETSP1068-20121228/26030_1 /TAXON_ID=35684 /ORGANISM="Pseudopedinella elastica, Strain CCMP716" /LENGTH=68 /DNA_ID=CAMNT_0013408331 /DNA_START=808 /DNA_END=1014 /DNA_ORIENTATION=-